jgi:hypothetical protein
MLFIRSGNHKFYIQFLGLLGLQPFRIINNVIICRFFQFLIVMGAFFYSLVCLPGEVTKTGKPFLIVFNRFGGNTWGTFLKILQI